MDDIKFIIFCNISGQRENIRNMIHPFFPQAVLEEADINDFEEAGSLCPGHYKLLLQISGRDAVKGYGRLLAPSGKTVRTVFLDRDICDPRYNKDDRQARIKEAIRVLTLRLLVRYLRIKQVPWGILTGVRPAKLIPYLAEKGFTFREIRRKLRNVYGLSRDKIQLLTEIHDNQKQLVPQIKQRPFISLFLNIPFCPSRCAYCSFPGYPLASHGHLVAPYLDALRREIRKTGEIIKDLGLKIDSIYCGGGTPTSLPEKDFALLFADLFEFVVKDSVPYEFTVEAGRPETITRGKLEVMKNTGVNRICVNPQTMKQETLDRIGRSHRIEDIEKAVANIRQAGIPVLNMDLIAGLPGENWKDFLSTLAAVMEFRPENLTIHTLAIKRAAAWRKEIPINPFVSGAQEMWRHSARVLKKNRYAPYYLYRQKLIRDNLENVGYARNGKYCRYNIAMMEERQEIIGLGAGAVTRLFSGPRRHFRITNPACPATYSKTAEEQFAKKVKIMLEVFS